MKRKLFCLLSIVLIFALVFSSCGKDDSSSSDSSASDSSSEGSSSESSKDESSSSGEGKSGETQNENAEIEAQVLYEQDGLKVSLKDKVEMTALGDYALYIEFENSSAENWELMTSNLKVEGATFGAYAFLGSVECQAGETNEAQFTISADKLAEVGINGLGKMEFKLDFNNPDDWDKDFESEYITVETSLSGKYTPVFETEGVEIINQDGFKLIGLGIVEGTLGPEYKYYVENNTDQDIEFRNSYEFETMINGEAAEFTLIAESDGNSKSYAVTFLDDEELAKYFEAGVSSMQVAVDVNSAEYGSDPIIPAQALVELIQ